jgi:hypothetical protein
MNRRLPWLLCLVVALLLVSEVRPLHAEGSAVMSHVRVIHATPGERGAPVMDPALQPIASYLSRSFGARYASFRELDQRALRLARGERTGFTLPDGRDLGLTYRGDERDFILLFMELPHLKTTVKVRNGGLFFQAGQPFEGGILILAIHASK